MAEAPATPKVTVAMVTYDSAAFVGQAIASVLAQDFGDFELLLCDDASRDATCEIAAGFPDPRVRIVRNPSNLGEYANRDQAVALARGEYLMFLDGDDYLYPHGLGTMVRLLDAHPRAAFASAQPPSDKFIYPVELTPHEFYACQFLGPNVTGRDFTQLLFRTQRLRELGGFDRRFRSGDTHVQFRLGMRHDVLLISDGLAWWRKYPGQASESLLRDLHGLAELTRYGQEALADPACPLTADERRLARANLCRLLLRNASRYARRGRLLRTLRLLREGGVAIRDWRFLFARDRRPFLGAVDGRAPFKAATR
jgi:glycosyltransferase involved in cell wall biosynthesis